MDELVKPKNSMSWLDIRAWISESREVLEGSFIDNIYHAGGQTSIFKIRTRNGSIRHLVVEPGRRIHFTRYKLEHVEEKLPPLIVALRRRIRDRRILKVEMLEGERIVKFTFKDRSLLVELLPRGVVVVVDSNGNIEYASEYREMKDRRIIKGQPYTPPPPRRADLDSLDENSLVRLISTGRDAVRGLVRGLGIPGEAAEEILYRSNVEKERSPDSITAEEASRILRSLRDILEEAAGGSGYIVKTDDVPVTVVPFRPTLLEGKYAVTRYSSFNEALDEYYHLISQLSSGDARRSEAEKLRRAMKEQEMRLREYLEMAEKYRLAAEKVASNIPSFSGLVECVNRMLEGVEECTQKYRVLELDRKGGRATVDIEGVKIDVERGDTPYRLMSRLYSKAKEYRRKAERVSEAMKELEEKLRRLEESERIEEEAARLKARPREWYERYHWTISPDNILIIGGRDAQQNESVVKKYLDEDNVFVHADIRGAPATIILCRGEPSAQAVREAAVITACYSRAWREKLGFVDVYWAYGRQVSKSPPPGEYLPKGSFMIYGKRNYVRGIPLRLALGVEIVEGYGRVIVGSEENVSAKTPYYLVLAPGDTSKEKLASRIKRILVERVEENVKPIMASIDVDEIVRRIPGPSTIVKISPKLRRSSG